MDSHTLELLEFDKVRALVASRAACSLGKSEARQLAPSTDPAEIHDRQSLTAEMVEAIRAGLRPSFGGLHDIRSLVRRAQVGAALEAEELAEVGETLRAIGDLDRWLNRIGDQFPRLGALRQGVGEFAGLVSAIDGCLDSRANVIDTASRRLSAIRREIHQVEERIQETLRHMLRSPEIRRSLRYPNFTRVGHHYVLPVSKDYRGEVEGAVLRASASNETVYIEPRSIGEKSAQLSLLRSRESKEIRRILRWLSAQVGMVADSLLGTLDAMAELDLIHAKARLAVDYRMSAPHFNQEGRLVLRGARHPLLEAMFRGDPAIARPAEADQEKTTTPEVPPPTVPLPPAREEPRTVVPIDVNLGLRFHMLVITGPNTGGKTVALKTVGLLAIMAQSGLHVPASEGCDFPIFDDVLADIGDEQSLEQSLSTFSSHIRRIGEILGKATERSLVLLDEMGAGTDPADGAALGRAILDELSAIGSRAIVTTHIGDLKTYALSTPGTENAAVEFDDETLQPRYRLHIGDIGQSNALKIARHLKLADHIINRAESYRSHRQGGDIPELEILQGLRKEAEEARESALRAQAEADRTREALNRRLAELQDETRQAETIGEARARLQPGDRVVVPRLGYDRPGRLVKLDPRKKTAVVAIGHVTWDVAVDEIIPQSIRTPTTAAASSPSKPSSRPTVPLDEFDGE